ncbi:MAG: hypothetical protein HYU66_15590 [Armatimonadetes bacterium]|nr:hypothetical protein [Armatimonadota bacterium]
MRRLLVMIMTVSVLWATAVVLVPARRGAAAADDIAAVARLIGVASEVLSVVPPPAEPAGQRRRSVLRLRGPDRLEVTYDLERRYISRLSGPRSTYRGPAAPQSALPRLARDLLARFHPRWRETDSLDEAPVYADNGFAAFSWRERRNGAWTGGNAALMLQLGSGRVMAYRAYVPPEHPRPATVSRELAINVLRQRYRTGDPASFRVTAAELWGASLLAPNEDPVWRISVETGSAAGEGSYRVEAVDAVTSEVCSLGGTTGG